MAWPLAGSCGSQQFSGSPSLMSVRPFAEARPVATAILCAAAQLVDTLLVLKVGFSLVPPEAAGKGKLVAFASTIVLPLVLAQVFGLWRRVGLGWREGRLTPAFAASLLVCLLWLVLGVHRPD